MHSSRRTSLDSAGLRERARGYSPRPVAAVQSRQYADIKSTPKPQKVIQNPAQSAVQNNPVKIVPQHTAAAVRPVIASRPIQSSTQPIQQQVAPTEHSKPRVLKLHAHKTHSKLMPTRRPVAVHKAMTPQNVAHVPTLPVPKQSKINQLKSSFALHKKGYALSALAVLLFLGGTFVNVRSFMTNQKIEAQVQAAAGGGEDGKPSATANYDETPVSVNAVSNYQVSPDMPRYLKIDKLSLFSRIKRVGVDAQNAIEAPKNVYDAGWYDGSAKPGEPGAVFIDGHVSGPTRGGIFVNLKKLKNGDSVKVEMGNGTKYTYRVVATERVPKDQVDMAKALRPFEQGKQGLNIMTCAGTYDKNSETYDFRYIVYTVREG